MLNPEELSTLLVMDRVHKDWVREIHSYRSRGKRKKHFVIFRNCCNRKVHTLAELRAEGVEVEQSRFQPALSHEIVSNKVGANKNARKAANNWMEEIKTLNEGTEGAMGHLKTPNATKEKTSLATNIQEINADLPLNENIFKYEDIPLNSIAKDIISVKNNADITPVVATINVANKGSPRMPTTTEIRKDCMVDNNPSSEISNHTIKHNENSNNTDGGDEICMEYVKQLQLMNTEISEVKGRKRKIATQKLETVGLINYLPEDFEDKMCLMTEKGLMNADQQKELDTSKRLFDTNKTEYVNNNGTTNVKDINNDVKDINQINEHDVLMLNNEQISLEEDPMQIENKEGKTSVKTKPLTKEESPPVCYDAPDFLEQTFVHEMRNIVNECSSFTNETFGTGGMEQSHLFDINIPVMNILDQAANTSGGVEAEQRKPKPIEKQSISKLPSIEEEKESMSLCSFGFDAKNKNDEIANKDENIAFSDTTDDIDTVIYTENKDSFEKVSNDLPLQKPIIEKSGEENRRLTLPINDVSDDWMEDNFGSMDDEEDESVQDEPVNTSVITKETTGALSVNDDDDSSKGVKQLINKTYEQVTKVLDTTNDEMENFMSRKKQKKLCLDKTLVETDKSISTDKTKQWVSINNEINTLKKGNIEKYTVTENEHNYFDINKFVTKIPEESSCFEKPTKSEDVISLKAPAKDIVVSSNSGLNLPINDVTDDWVNDEVLSQMNSSSCDEDDSIISQLSDHPRDDFDQTDEEYLWSSNDAEEVIGNKLPIHESVGDSLRKTSECSPGKDLVEKETYIKKFNPNEIETRTYFDKNEENIDTEDDNLNCEDIALPLLDSKDVEKAASSLVEVASTLVEVVNILEGVATIVDKVDDEAKINLDENSLETSTHAQEVNERVKDFKTL